LLNLIPFLPGIARIEVDRALTNLIAALRQEKEKGYPNGIPVIWINGIEAVEINNEENEKDKDQFETGLSKFLNFAIYASDNKLAHIVLTTTFDFSEKFLDKRNLIS
jgi:hypothetical protein